MPYGFAVLDSSVVILLVTSKQDDSPTEQADEQRRQNCRDWIERLGASVRWAIPAVVVAELARPHPARAMIEHLAQHLGRLRILPFTRPAGEVAARMATDRLANRGNAPRGAVKFDTLIAATAHVYGAKYLLSANERDFESALKIVRSAVEVIDAKNRRAGIQSVIAFPQKPSA